MVVTRLGQRLPSALGWRNRRLSGKCRGFEIKSKAIPAIVITVVMLAVLGGMAIAAQDRFTLKVPNGLAFSEFRGYET